MHLIILASQSTVTVRGLGLCCCVPCYVSDICQLWLRLLSLSLSAGFHCRWKDQRWLGSEKTHTHTHIEGMERRIIVLLSSRMTKRARVTKHAGSASNLSDKTCCSDKTCHHRASLFIVSLKGVL